MTQIFKVKKRNEDQSGIVDQYRFHTPTNTYASDEEYQEKLKTIIRNHAGKYIKHNRPEEIEEYIRAYKPNSPLNGFMIYKAARKSGVEPIVEAARAHLESQFGTEGSGVRNYSPTGYGQFDTGEDLKMEGKTEHEKWQSGLDKGARGAAKRHITRLDEGGNYIPNSKFGPIGSNEDPDSDGPKLFKVAKAAEHPLVKPLEAKINESQHKIAEEHEPTISRMKQEYLARKEMLRKKWQEEAFKAKTDEPAIQPEQEQSLTDQLKGGVYGLGDLINGKITGKQLKEEVLNTASNIGKKITFGLGNMVSNLAETYQYHKEGKQNIERINQSNLEQQNKINDYIKKPDVSPETKQHLLKLSEELTKPTTAKDIYEFAGKDYSQVVGDAIGAAADILTLGGATAGYKLALSKGGIKPVIKYLFSREGVKFLAKESLSGAENFTMGGVGQSIQNKESFMETIKKIPENAVTGAIAQPAFELVAGILGSKIAKTRFGTSTEDLPFGLSVKKVGEGPTNFENPLIQEAGKEIKVYRGGLLIDKTKITKEGISVAKTKESASRFITQDSSGFPRKGGTLQEFVIDPKAKILDPSELNAQKIKADWNWDNLREYARKNGYDAIDFSKIEHKTREAMGYRREEEINILNPDILKSPSLIQEAKKESLMTKGFTDLRATAKNQAQTAKPTPASSGLSQPKTTQSKTLGSELDNIVDSTPSQATPSSFEKIRNWFKESRTKSREVVQDNWIRVKKLQENPTVKQNEKLNPYDAEILYHGRVGARLEAVKDEAKNIDKDILDTSKKLGEKDQTLKGVINKYLVAQHAPERNLQHGEGAAGMTTEEAKGIVQQVESTGASGEIKRISQSIKDINDTTLEILKEGQVISDETYQILKKTYKNHVPLQRIFEETEDVNDLLINKGLNVKGTGIKRAKGSEREVSDILGNVVANVEQAVVRAEKNRVNLATLEFSRNNPELGLFEEMKPKLLGQTLDGKPIFENVTDPLVLHVREQGKPVYLKIKDETLAKVFQGIGNDKIPPVLNFVSAYSRFYSGLSTRFSPEFAFSNKVRDLQEMAVYMAAQKDIGFGGAAKTGFRDLASMKSIVEGLAGKETEGARLYNQMKLDGGTTGGMALSTKKAVDVDMAKLERLNRSNPRKAGEYVLNAIDSWNTVFEDSTRLSVYKTALDKGLNRDAAAVLAKTSTVNFNKKGTGGPIINAVWMFSNASIQGTAKFMQSMKNPKVAGAVATAVGGSVFAVNKWNDSIDPEWRDKVSKWDRLNNMVVMYPSSEGAKYFTIPVSWALKPMKVGADYVTDLASGKNVGSVASNVNKFVGATLDAYNPLGGTDAASAVTPTILDLPEDIWRNKQWTGSPIKPDWKAGLPKADQFYDSLSKSWLGQQLIKASQTMSENTARTIDISPADANYAISQMIGGTGRAVSGVINTITSATKGETPPARETPFLRRFFKSRTEEEIQKSQTSQQGGNFYDALKQLKTGSEEQKLMIQDYLKSVPDDSLRSKEAFKLREMGFDMKGIKTSKKSIEALTEQPVFDHIRNLVKEGKTSEAESIVKFMPEDEYDKYVILRTEWRKENTKQFKDALESNPVEAVKYARSLDKDEGVRIVNNLSDEEYALYEKAKKELDKN